MNKKPKIKKTRITLYAYNKSKIPSHGEISVDLKYKKTEMKTKFLLVDDERQPIIGLETAEAMGFVARVQAVEQDLKGTVLKKYPELFNGKKLGCLPQSHEIRLKESAIPTIDAQRKVPVAIRKDYKKTLDKMVELEVIKKIDEPTEWVSSPVLVRKKSGEIRVCLDPRSLNENIMREHYPLPVKSELTSDMGRAKYFTKLDARMAFWQVPLKEESQKLCTFNTPFGRYCYRRLPYGITSASEVFHKTVQQIFDDIDGVKVYIDDLVIWGESKEQHDERLFQVLDRAKQVNLTLNLNKCEFRVRKITYLGEVLSEDGVQPDPEKIRAITEMPRPCTKKDVQRLLGMANYVSKFIPHLANRTIAIRSLIEKKSEWSWKPEHEAEFKDIQSALTSSQILKHYDLSKEVKVSTDASNKGLGAVLYQKHGEDWLPVHYASRALTPTEQKYAAIEKEALGLVFGCQKFDEYIYGREISLETDHKPLVSIQKKPLADVSPRLQRLMLKLQRWDIKMEWTKGKDLHIPDTLSRAYLKESKDDSELDEEIECHVNAVLEELPVSQTMWKKIAAHTEADVVLQKVISCIANGWKKDCPNQYYHYREELTVINGVVLKGRRIVVPKSLQQEMLEIIHEGHLGVEKCKRRARKVLYWLNMNNDIEELASRCETCNIHQSSQTKEPIMQHHIPSKPWLKLGADLFNLNGREYLLVIDYYSNYPEVALLEEISSKAVINKLKSIFSRHGIPSKLITDNGRQFISSEFKSFTDYYNINHSTSSPTLARSNGKAEKGVGIVKKLLKKAAEKGEDQYLAMLNYRAAPLDCGYSPAELLMNRRL